MADLAYTRKRLYYHKPAAVLESTILYTSVREKLLSINKIQPIYILIPFLGDLGTNK